jgi:helix-turn-helix protein
MDNKLLNTDEAASFVGVMAATLAAWRIHRNQGLNFIKCGRRVYYRVEDLRAYLAKRTVVTEEMAGRTVVTREMTAS